MVFAIDRGGLVGDDGPTHHGVFDIAYLRPIPGMVLMAPMDEAELVHMLHTALRLDGPSALRYPRGAGTGVPLPERPEVLDPILELLREGHSVRQSVRSGGVTDATFMLWEKKGEAGIEPYASHLAEIEEAKAQGAIRLEGKVMKGEPGWQGAAWLLERTRRTVYGKHDQLTLHREDELAEVGDDELEHLIDEAEVAEAG